MKLLPRTNLFSSKILINISFIFLVTLNLSFSKDREFQEDYFQILDLPRDPMTCVLKHLEKEDIKNLRLVSHDMKENVDGCYQGNKVKVPQEVHKWLSNLEETKINKRKLAFQEWGGRIYNDFSCGGTLMVFGTGGMIISGAFLGYNTLKTIAWELPSYLIKSTIAIGRPNNRSFKRFEGGKLMVEGITAMILSGASLGYGAYTILNTTVGELPSYLIESSIDKLATNCKKRKKSD